MAAFLIVIGEFVFFANENEEKRSAKRKKEIFDLLKLFIAPSTLKMNGFFPTQAK